MRLGELATKFEQSGQLRSKRLALTSTINKINYQKSLINY